MLGRRCLCALLATLAIAAPLCAQQVDELIRAHVEHLAATGELDIDGVSIAARNLIPRLYEARAFTPTWHSVAQVDELLEVIDAAYREGLDPADYHVEAVRAARESLAAVAALASADRAGLDIVLTDSIIRLGYHLRFGKLDPVELDPHWNWNRSLVDLDAVATIQAAIDAPSLREFASQVIQRNPFHARLVTALAEYRALAATGGWPMIAPGPTIKPGMRDARVPALRVRLAATGDVEAGVADPAGDAYGGEIVAAIQRFQGRHGLAPDGVVGPATLAALNVPVADRIEQIRVNLERTRWVVHELQDDFLAVNIAGFRAYLVRDGEVVWTTRAQVGQPYRRTPIFSATMSYLVFNPTWTVPPTILRGDILPALRRDPAYLASRAIDLVDDSGMSVDPATVDWWSQSAFPFRFVQRPGPNNALGRVKFMFPNEHFVYLHDTPSRDLFEHESRAFSSGCIRIEHPLELARLLLGEEWSPERIEALLASERTETVFLEDPIPVFLLYWTAEVEAGRVVFRPDVYARDAAVREALAAPFRAASI